MRSNKVIYRLVVADIQEVANQELSRNLTDTEIDKIIDAISENINWYDVIADSINASINEADA